MKNMLLPAIAATLMLSGCELFENDGKLDLNITDDAPYTQIKSVVVTVRKIRLEAEDGGHETFDLDPAIQVDLRSLTGGQTRALLSDEALKSGDYESIRLTLSDSSDDNYVEEVDGTRHDLDVNDDEIELATDFSIDDHGTTQLTLAVDLRRGLREDDDDYRFVADSALHLTNDEDTGTVTGTIPVSKIDDDCAGAAVYVYKGKDVTPDDIGGTGTEPYSSTIVSMGSDGLYHYTAAFLPEGDYTLGLTCDADEDDPVDNDSLDFDTETVKVKAKDTETQNF